MACCRSAAGGGTRDALHSGTPWHGLRERLDNGTFRVVGATGLVSGTATEPVLASGVGSLSDAEHRGDACLSLVVVRESAVTVQGHRGVACEGVRMLARSFLVVKAEPDKYSKVRSKLYL